MTRATEIADELQRLCCAETEGAFFDYVTESVGTIQRHLRQNQELRAALQEALTYCDQAYGEHDQYASDRERLLNLAYEGRQENTEAEINSPHSMGC